MSFLLLYNVNGFSLPIEVIYPFLQCRLYIFFHIIGYFISSPGISLMRTTLIDVEVKLKK